MTEVTNEPHFVQDFRITDLVERYSENLKGKQIEGYRIQLYSGKRENAKDLRKQSISVFPEIECVLIYETPDFKVQMGNFRTELEAEKYLRKIRQTFNAAFIVKSNIDLPQLLIENSKTEED